MGIPVIIANWIRQSNHSDKSISPRCGDSLIGVIVMLFTIDKDEMLDVLIGLISNRFNTSSE
jgi:hypothetical protein